MTERGKEQGPFDERAALGELERFRADIERYRKQREVVSEDFEEFVRSFPSPVDVFPSEQPAAGTPGIRDFGTPSASQTSSTQAAQPARPAQRAVPTPAPPAPPPPATKSPVETARPATAPAPPATKVEKPKRTGMPLVATLLLLLIVAAVGVWMFRGGQLQPQTSNVETAQPAAPVDRAPAPAPPPAVAPAPVESEITTVRRAWVRVIADGERVLERELPADTRVPFKAEKTIVIRTGDAGAVRLTIRGEDHGTLGRDGEVVTRSFTVPASQSR